MRKIWFIIAAVGFAAVSCNPSGEEETQPSLEVSPLSLTFAAEAAPSQELTVKALNVEWEYKLAENASGWVKVSGDHQKGILTVSVTDNPKDQQRTASLTIAPVAGSGTKVKDKTVTIVQQPSQTPVVYSLEVEPASLTFESEGAKAQEVTVTTQGDGLEWSAEVEEAARGWITVTEGDGKFTVAVADNPETDERAGNIVVTPSEESASPKVVRVVQKERVLPPSLGITLSNGAAPEDGFVFNYLGDNKGYYVDVKAVNIDWRWKVEYDSEPTGWITVQNDETSEYTYLRILLTNQTNQSPDPRIGRIVINTDQDGIGPYEVKVLQEGKPEFQSTILENVEIAEVTGTRALVYPNNDKRQLTYTQWEITLWNESIAYVPNFGKFTGSGGILKFTIATNPIEKNEEGIYRIPDGIYRLAPNFEGKNEDGTPIIPEPFTVSGGERGLWNHPATAKGVWYLRMQDDKYNGEEARITSGSLTVTGAADGTYKLECDFVSDAAYHVTVIYEGTISVEVVG